MNNVNLTATSNQKFSIKKYYSQGICACVFTLAASWAVPSTLDLPNYITNFYYLLSAFGFLIFFISVFRLSAFTFFSLYCALVISSLCLLGFFVGITSQNTDLIQTGNALGTPPLNYIILIICISIAFFILYKTYHNVDRIKYFNDTLLAKNYDLEKRYYFIDCPNKELEIKWNFSDKLNKLNTILALIIFFIPFGTSSIYITLMSHYHPFNLNRIAFYCSLPAFLLFSYGAIICYFRYSAYNYVQKKLGTKLRPTTKL